MTKFRQPLVHIDWVKEFQNKNTQEMWDKFKSILEDFQTQCTPDKCIRKTKTRKPLWWNRETGIKVQEKKRAFMNYKGSNRRRFKYL